MSAFQDEIARIIRGFSAKERELFAQMGGKVANVLPPEPKWFRPGVDRAVGTGFQEHVTHERDSTNFVKVQLDSGGIYTLSEAAALLHVTEHVLRNRVNRADECEVRGVKVKRMTPRREKAA